MNPLELAYKFKWIKKTVKQTDGKLKCSQCKYIFKIGDKVYVKFNRWNSAYGDKILCINCKDESLKNRPSYKDK